jgi:6-phosphogluconolactonase
MQKGEQFMADSLVIIVASNSKTLITATLSGSDGRLSGVTSLPLPEVEGSNGSSPLAISPDRQKLYVAFRGTPHAVLSFKIDYAGRKLDYLGQSPLADSMAYISTDATGRWLFSASYSGGKFAINPIGADGVAGDIRQALDIGPKAHCAVRALDNSKVYVVSLGTDSILRFGFNAETGAVEPLPAAATTPKGTGPRHLIFDRSGRFAYVVNELIGTVDAYAVDAEGAFTRIQSADITADGFTGKPQAADIHLTPDGRLLYASERGSNTMAGFTVDSGSGRLTPAGKIAVPAAPRGFAISPDGRHMVCLGDKDGKAAVLAIDAASGRLTEVERIDAGDGPNWVEILPLAG